MRVVSLGASNIWGWIGLPWVIWIILGDIWIPEVVPFRGLCRLGLPWVILGYQSTTDPDILNVHFGWGYLGLLGGLSGRDES